MLSRCFVLDFGWTLLCDEPPADSKKGVIRLPKDVRDGFSGKTKNLADIEYDLGSSGGSSDSTADKAEAATLPVEILVIQDKAATALTRAALGEITVMAPEVPVAALAIQTAMVQVVMEPVVRVQVATERVVPVRMVMGPWRATYERVAKGPVRLEGSSQFSSTGFGSTVRAIDRKLVDHPSR